MRNSEIVEIIKNVIIDCLDCPDCQWVDDYQYCYTTCWCQGGNGKIDVVSYLKDHKSVMVELGLIKE